MSHRASSYTSSTSRAIRRPISCVAVSPRELQHPLFGRLAIHPMRREIAARAGPAEHQVVGRVALLHLLAHVVPEIGIQGRASFHFLRRTGHVDGRGQRLLLLVPEVKQLDAAVGPAFETLKVRAVGRPVHLRRAVGVGRAAVVADDRMAQPPTHAARLTRIPGSGGHLRQLADEELDVLGRLHRRLGNIVLAFLGHRRGVRVRRADDQLASIEVLKPRGKPFAHGLRDRRANRHEVAGDE